MSLVFGLLCSCAVLLDFDKLALQFIFLFHLTRDIGLVVALLSPLVEEQSVRTVRHLRHAVHAAPVALAVTPETRIININYTVKKHYPFWDENTVNY